MSDQPTIGWQVLDPDGNVVDSGEAVVIQVDVFDELQNRLAALNRGDD